MIIESLRLFYHLRCFQCCVCHVQLGNGSVGTDVRVRNNRLHCQNCYSNDEGEHLGDLYVIRSWLLNNSFPFKVSSSARCEED